MPLWFWIAWQAVGLGLMGFGVAALVKAIWENKKNSVERQLKRSKEKPTIDSIAKKKGNVK